MITKKECMELSRQLEKYINVDDFLGSLSNAVRHVKFLPTGSLNPASIYGYFNDVSIGITNYEEEYAYLCLYIKLLDELGIPINVFCKRVNELIHSIDKDDNSYKRGMLWAAMRLKRIHLDENMNHITYEFAEKNLNNSGIKDKDFLKGVNSALHRVFMR